MTLDEARAAVLTSTPGTPVGDLARFAVAQAEWAERVEARERTVLDAAAERTRARLNAEDARDAMRARAEAAERERDEAADQRFHLHRALSAAEKRAERLAAALTEVRLDLWYQIEARHGPKVASEYPSILRAITVLAESAAAALAPDPIKSAPVLSESKTPEKPLQAVAGTNSASESVSRAEVPDDEKCHGRGCTRRRMHRERVPEGPWAANCCGDEDCCDLANGWTLVDPAPAQMAASRDMLAPGPSETERVLADVAAERVRQTAKWGVQNWPDGTGGPSREMVADSLKAACRVAFERGIGTWRHILAEEVAEAFAESDPVRLREELVQVAAVAVSWSEAIGRRGESK